MHEQILKYPFHPLIIYHNHSILQTSFLLVTVQSVYLAAFQRYFGFFVYPAEWYQFALSDKAAERYRNSFMQLDVSEKPALFLHLLQIHFQIYRAKLHDQHLSSVLVFLTCDIVLYSTLTSSFSQYEA